MDLLGTLSTSTHALNCRVELWSKASVSTRGKVLGCGKLINTAVRKH